MISSLTSPTASAASTAGGLAGATGNADLGRDEFLQLLVAQLRNQDPTSPQQGHEFAAQLAQFSSVEQLTHIDASISAQAELLAGLTNALTGLQTGQSDMASELSGRIDLQAATGLIGQTVEVANGAIAWSGEGTADVSLRLPSDVREVTVTIRDAKGDVVRTLRSDALSAGDHTLSWDGAQSDGAPAPAGAYTATVEALGPEGRPVKATPVLTGAVDRLTVEGDGVYLWLGDHRVPFSSLLSVR